MDDDRNLIILERLLAQREFLKTIAGRTWNNPIDKLEELIALHLDKMVSIEEIAKKEREATIKKQSESVKND